MQAPPYSDQTRKKKPRATRSGASGVQAPPAPGSDAAQKLLTDRAATRRAEQQTQDAKAFVERGNSRRKAEADRIRRERDAQYVSQAENSPQIAGKREDARRSNERVAQVRQATAARRGIAAPPEFGTDVDAKTVKSLGGRYKSVGQRKTGNRPVTPPALPRTTNDQQRRRTRNLVKAHELGVRNQVDAVYEQARKRPPKGQRVNPDNLHAQAEQIVSSAQAAQAAKPDTSAATPGTPASKDTAQLPAKAADADNDGKLSPREQAALDTYTKFMSQSPGEYETAADFYPQQHQRALEAARLIHPKFGANPNSTVGAQAAQGSAAGAQAAIAGTPPATGLTGLNVTPPTAYLPQAQYTGAQTAQQERASLNQLAPTVPPPAPPATPAPVAPPALVASQPGVLPAAGGIAAPPITTGLPAASAARQPAPVLQAVSPTQLAAQGIAGNRPNIPPPSLIPPAQQQQASATPSRSRGGVATRVHEQATQPGANTIRLQGVPAIDNALVSGAPSGTLIVAANGQQFRKR